jgi:hypothetical protein
MDKWWGRLFGQFQNFMFAFVHAYIQPMMQRAVHYQDMQVATSFATLMVTGAITMAIKDLQHGQDPAKRWEDLTKDPKSFLKTGIELADRSMLLGYLSPYVDAGVKMTGLTGSTRYERNDALQSILGVNSSLIGDVGHFASSLASQASSQPDKVEATLKKGIALAPFSGLLRMGHHLYFGSSPQQP